MRIVDRKRAGLDHAVIWDVPPFFCKNRDEESMKAGPWGDTWVYVDQITCVSVCHILE